MPVTLVGDGLVLRPWREDDLPAMPALFDHPDVALRTPLPSPFGPAEAAARLALARRPDVLALAVTLDGGAPLGEVVLLASGDLGYVLGPQHRGKGLATRAVALLRDHAHDVVGLPVVGLEIEPDNAPSAAVARRTGFVLAQPAASEVEDKGRRYVLDRWEHTARR